MPQRVGLVLSVFKKQLRLARTSEVTLSSPCSRTSRLPRPMSREILNIFGDRPQALSATCSSPRSPLQLCDDQTEPPVFHFVLTASWTPLERAQHTFFNPSFRYLYPPMRLPWAFSPVSWTVPVLLAIPWWNFQYCFPVFCFSRHLQT